MFIGFLKLLVAIVLLLVHLLGLLCLLRVRLLILLGTSLHRCFATSVIRTLASPWVLEPKFTA